MPLTGTFGRVLRELIASEFGTQQRFAEHAALSPGRISQLVRGHSPALTLSSLEPILDCFPKADDKERLYRAWLSGTAHSPSLQPPKVESSDEEILAYCRAIPGLIRERRVLSVFQTTRDLWQGLRGNRGRFEAASRCGIAHSEACFELERRPEGLRVCAELASWAIGLNEPAAVAHSLWLKLVGTRILHADDPALAVAAFNDFGSYVSSCRWQDRSVHREFTGGALRDGALLALDLVKADPSASGVLAARIELLGSRIERFDRPSEITLCQEIRGRGLTQLGRFDEAHEALQQASRGPQPDHPAHQIKTRLAFAHLYLVDRQPDLAESKLLEAKDSCERLGLLHYNSRTVELLNRLP